MNLNETKEVILNVPLHLGQVWESMSKSNDKFIKLAGLHSELINTSTLFFLIEHLLFLIILPLIIVYFIKKNKQIVGFLSLVVCFLIMNFIQSWSWDNVIIYWDKMKVEKMDKNNFKGKV